MVLENTMNLHFLLQGVILYHIIQKKFPTETGVILVGSGRGLGFFQK